MTAGNVVLGDVVTVVDCEHRTAPRADATEVFGYSVGTSNVRGGRVSLDAAKPVTRRTFEAWTRRAVPRPGDLIFSREAPMGEVGEVPTTVPVCLGQRTVLLQARDDLVDRRYLKHLLMAPESQRWISDNSAGTTVLHLNVADVRRIPVGVLPPLEHQRRIVDLLEDHLSRVEAAQRELAVVSAKAQTLSLASTVGLFSRGTRSHVSLAFGDRALPLPVGWGACRLHEVAQLVEYGTGSKTSEAAGPEAVPVLRMGNLKGGRLDLSRLKYLPGCHADFPKLLLRPGDLLFNRTNSAEHVGKSAVFHGEMEAASFASYLIRVRFTADVLPEWANIVINSPFGRSYVASVVSQQVGQANVNGTKLKGFPLPLPPVETQRALVDEHEELLVNLRRLAQTTTLHRERTQALRRSLLAAVFSGRLRCDV